MKSLEILTYPDKLLTRPSEPVDEINGSIQKIIDSMVQTMYQASGIGLAAIQVGIDKRIIVYDISRDENKRSLQVLINPEVISQKGESISEKEGCLSFPDFRTDVKRADSVFVKGLDRDGNPVNIEADGLLSMVLQHEIDHLNGILFIDRISALKRALYKKKIRKQQKKINAKK